MDLSFLKWPLIAAIVVFALWLLSEGSVNFMYNRFTSGTPGEDAQRDAVNEAGLSKLGGFLVKTFRYEKAEAILRLAVERYPMGRNYYKNWLAIARCLEKQERRREAVAALERLVEANAHDKDPRLPENDVLRARIEKLVEVYGLAR